VQVAPNGPCNHFWVGRRDNTEDFIDPVTLNRDVAQQIYAIYPDDILQFL
jgi:hypothetical protein